MKKNHTGRFIAFLIFYTFIAFPTDGIAALPFTIKPGHPRVYVDSTRVAEIRAASQATTPLNGIAFPQQAGTLSFDIYALPRTDTTQSENLGIFDGHDSGRNHAFIRHLDQEQTDSQGNGMGVTYCNTPIGTPGSPPAVLCFQVGLQSTQLPTSYIASRNFTLTANQWHTLSVSWNAAAHTASFAVDGTTYPMGWSKDTAGTFYEWSPNNQNFIFTGRDQLDNIRLYNSDNPAPGNLLTNFPMSEGTGRLTSDALGQIKALLSTGVSWSARTVGGADYVLQFDGQPGARMWIKPNSVLMSAWQDTYALAVYFANNLNTGVSPNGGVAEVAHVIGLAWMVTGEVQFRTAGLKYAELLMAVPVAEGGEYSQNPRVEAMGIIYDWLFDVVRTTSLPDGRTYGAALADAVKQTLLTVSTSSTVMLGSAICGYDKQTGLLRNVVDTGNNLVCSGPSTLPTIQENYIGGHNYEDNSKTAMALLAMYDEHSEFRSLLSDAIYYNFVHNNAGNVLDGFLPARAWIGVDGGHHMGWAYGAAYTDLLPIKLWGMATTDVNFLAGWQGQLVYRYIYGLRGDALSFPASGDGVDPLWDARLSVFALWSMSNFADPYAQRFYERWTLPLMSRNRLPELLFWHGDVPSTPLENLPYSRLFHNSGQALMRDTWDYPSATLLEFKSTSFWSENHHHLDQNAFTIYYKAPLLIDSGYYGGADEYGSAHWNNYYTRTIAHNTLTVFDPSETFSKYGTIYSNDGGQRFITPFYPTLLQIQSGGSNHLDGVTAYEYTPEFTYVLGNASKAYSAVKLDQTNGFLRSLIFLRSPNFWAKPITVVFDKVTAASGKGSLAKRFLMHSVNEPLSAPGGFAAGPTMNSIMPGNTAVFQNGGGMLFSQTLLPENPVLTKMGGKDSVNDYRFLAQVKDASSNYRYQNFGLTTPELDVAKNPDVGAWRVEVGTAAPTEREYFLNILSIADNNGTVSAPPSAQNLSSPTAAVALLGGSQIVAFSKGDQPAASLSWNTPISDTKMLVAGLVPNAAYSGNIAKNGSSSLPYTINLYQNQNGSLIASSQGVLAINSSVVSMGVDLAVTLSDTPDPVLVNNRLTYTLTVSNVGPSGATGVRVVDVLPVGVTFVSATPTTCTGTTTVTCALGSLAAGASSTVTLIVNPKTTGTLTNSASVSALEFDPVQSNNAASATTTVARNCRGTSDSYKYTLSGKVLTGTDSAISKATLNVRGPNNCLAQTTSSNEGNYNIGKFISGDYTVTPVKTGCSFTPATKTLSISRNTTQNFTGVCQ